MLTCIACSKHVQQLEHQHQSEDEDFENSSNVSTPTTKHAIKALTAQIKDIALKASGAYRHCKPCSGSSEGSNANAHRQHHNSYAESDAAATDRFHGGGGSYRRTGSSSSTPRLWGKEMEARLKGISSSSGEATPTPTPSASAILKKSSRRAATDSSVVVLTQQQRQQEGEEEEPKEWVAQVEPGVLITFVSLPMPRGGNDLKRIRFSREMFNKWQAQRWWAENYDKVMELYNVQRFNQQAVPLPNALRSEDESSKVESAEESPITPPLSKERLPRNFHRPLGMGYSSSDSLEHHPMQSRHYYDSMGLTSTPKLSSISGAKTETSSLDASIRTSSSREADRSGELSISNASDMETEWVEQDEPGVYITIRALPGNIRELRRVRFSREKFGEMHARLWWEENRARIHEQYL